MPATSPAQRRLFALAEHHPNELYAKNKGLADLPHKTLHDFAATHFADGGTMASNSTFQQNEATGNGVDWMERARNMKPPSVASTKMPQATNAKFRAKPPSQVPHMADGGHWMKSAFKNAGKPGHSLKRSLHVASDKTIPAAKLSSALHSDNPHMRKMANLARNANK